MTEKQAWEIIEQRVYKNPCQIPHEKACKTCMGYGFEFGMSPQDGSDCLYLDENDQAIPCPDCGGTGFNRKAKLEKLLS